MKWTPEEVKGKTPQQLVAMQMEDWLFDDPALMESYKPEKVADCLDWVADKVRLNAEHAGVAVCCHEEVFRMARDYFVDGHAKDGANDAKTPEKAKVGTASAKKTEETQTSLFGVAAKGGS